MKKFILNIILFLIVFWTVAFGLQTIIDKGLQQQQNDTYKDWNLIFNGKINSDIIILGSSRATAHFNPKIIGKKTNLQCYNIGVTAGLTVLQLAKWKAYIYNTNKKPDLLIFNVDIWSLGKRRSTLPDLLPYSNHSCIFDKLKIFDDKFIFTRYVPLLKYKKSYKLISTGILSFFYIRNYRNYKKTRGFLANDFIPENIDEQLKKHKVILREFPNIKKQLYDDTLFFNEKHLNLGLKIIDEIINDCKKNNIQIILVQSPIYHKLQNLTPQQKNITLKFDSISKQNNIKFWNYLNNSICFNTAYFENSMHLNKNGAKYFSTMIGDSLSIFMKR